MPFTERHEDRMKLMLSSRQARPPPPSPLE